MPQPFSPPNGMGLGQGNEKDRSRDGTIFGMIRNRINLNPKNLQSVSPSPTYLFSRWWSNLSGSVSWWSVVWCLACLLVNSPKLELTTGSTVFSYKLLTKIHPHLVLHVKEEMLPFSSQFERGSIYWFLWQASLNDRETSPALKVIKNLVMGLDGSTSLPYHLDRPTYHNQQLVSNEMLHMLLKKISLPVNYF